MNKKNSIKMFIIMLSFITLFNIYSASKKKIVKKEKKYIISFYMPTIEGTTISMRYYYKFNVNFNLKVKETFNIYKVNIYIPSNSEYMHSENNTIILHKGDYNFSIPVLIKKNIDFESYKIRIYLKKPQVNNANNNNANASSNSTSNNSSNQNNGNISRINTKKYKEYIIRKIDFN